MARGIWKGTLGFGLVSIGVELHSAESAERLDLDLLDRRDMGRIGYQKINKTTGDIVPQQEIVRGYAVTKQRYVILTDTDIKAANPKATQTIDIFGFVEAEAVARIYFAKPYYVTPLKGSEKAYTLLHQALHRTERLGLAHVVIHTRQYVAAVYPYEGAIVVQLLRYDHELKDPSDVGVRPSKAPARAARPQELAMAEQLIDSMATKWKPSDYRDEYRDDLMRLVKRRARSGTKRSQEPVKVEAPEPRVLDRKSVV